VLLLNECLLLLFISLQTQSRNFLIHPHILTAFELVEKLDFPFADAFVLLVRCSKWSVLAARIIFHFFKL